MTPINTVPNLCPLQILKLYFDDQLVMVNLGRHENPKKCLDAGVGRPVYGVVLKSTDNGI